jgi:hypothetical protein
LESDKALVNAGDWGGVGVVVLVVVVRKAAAAGESLGARVSTGICAKEVYCTQKKYKIIT